MCANGNGIPLTALLVWCLGTDRPIISAPTRSVLTMYSRREAKKITLKRESGVCVCVCVCVGGGWGGGGELTQRQLISLTFKSRDPNANRGLTRHHGNK